MKILIIITSDVINLDRFISGSEWENGWRFPSVDIVVRQNGEKLEYFFLKDIAKLQIYNQTSEMIVWINGKSDERPEVNLLLNRLAAIEKSQIWIAHIILINRPISQPWAKLSKAKYLPYTLATGRYEAFKKIIKGKYLNPESSFKLILESFMSFSQ